MLRFLQQVVAMTIAVPTKWVRSRYKSTDFYAVLSTCRGSQCPAGNLPGLSTYPTPKLEVAKAPYSTFRLFMPPPVPKIKMARATSRLWFCLWLFQPVMSIAMPTKWVKAYQSATSKWGWGFHTVRGGITRGISASVPRLLEL